MLASDFKKELKCYTWNQNPIQRGRYHTKVETETQKNWITNFSKDTQGVSLEIQILAFLTARKIYLLSMGPFQSTWNHSWIDA